MSVRRWEIWLAEHGLVRESAKSGLKTPASRVVLDPGSVQGISRGTAYLATRSRPAIKVAMEPGAITLAFEDEADRDWAMSVLRALSRGEVLSTTGSSAAPMDKHKSPSSRSDVWNDKVWERRTTDNLGWIEPLALAVCVSSAWRLLALAGLGYTDSIATSTAVAVAWLALVRREAGRSPGQRHIGSMLFAGVLATITLFIPLGYGIGHGAPASAFLLALSGVFLLEAYLRGRGGAGQSS